MTKVVDFGRGGIKPWLLGSPEPFWSVASFEETFPRFAACVCMFYPASCGTDLLVLVLRSRWAVRPCLSFPYHSWLWRFLFLWSCLSSSLKCLVLLHHSSQNSCSRPLGHYCCPSLNLFPEATWKYWSLKVNTFLLNRVFSQ